MISRNRFFFESCTLAESDEMFIDTVEGLKYCNNEYLRIADWYATNVKHPTIPFFAYAAKAVRRLTSGKELATRYEKEKLKDFFELQYFTSLGDPVVKFNDILIDYNLKYKQFKEGREVSNEEIVEELKNKNLLQTTDVTEDLFFFICYSAGIIPWYYGKNLNDKVFPYDACALNFINKSGTRFDGGDMENWEYVLKENKLDALKNVSKSQFKLFKTIVNKRINKDMHKWDIFEDAEKFKLNKEAFLFAMRLIDSTIDKKGTYDSYAEEQDGQANESSKSASNSLDALKTVVEDKQEPDVIEDKKVEIKKKINNITTQETSRFHLTGRRELNEFFNKSIIDVIENEDIYAAFGIDFPEPFILEGPPGCGKTYAVEQLEKYLNLPSFHITSSSVGSPWVHATAVSIEDTFKKARQHDKSLVVIDEMEAFVSSRQNTKYSDSHTIEEVDSFLKCIQKAQEDRILVIGMTNFIEKVDPAILRTGRMGTHIKVSWPSEEEITQVMQFELDKRPHDDLDASVYAGKFIQHPLSDVTAAVRKAAMTAAFNRATMIKAKDLEAAIEFVLKHNIGIKDLEQTTNK